MLLRGEGCCFRLDRGGGRRKVSRDREDRLDEMLDQLDQERAKPIPAAVGGQALGDLAASFGEPLRRGGGGGGGGVQAAELEYLTVRVKGDCAAVTIRHVVLERVALRRPRLLADRRAAASMSPSKTQAVSVCPVRWSAWEALLGGPD